MEKIIGHYVDGSTSYDQYRSAIHAVVQRALDKGELFTSVIEDQLVFVAASIMLDHENGDGEGSLEAWCNDRVKRMEQNFAAKRAIVDKLMGKDGAE